MLEGHDIHPLRVDEWQCSCGAVLDGDVEVIEHLVEEVKAEMEAKDAE